MKNFVVVLAALTVTTGLLVGFGAIVAKSNNDDLPCLSVEGERLCKRAVQMGSLQYVVDTDVETLVKLIDCYDPTIRRGAIHTLGERKAEDAVESLIHRLEDRDHHTRRLAARALGKIGDLRATPGLIQSLGHHGEALAVRCDAAWALGRMADPRAGLALKEVGARSRGRLKEACLAARRNHLVLVAGGRD